MVTTISRPRYLFLVVFERYYVTYLYLLAFMNVLLSHTLIYWWLRKFNIKTLYFLMGTNISRHLPLFLDSFGRFTLNFFPSWRLRTFPVKTFIFSMVTKFLSSKISPDSTNRVFFARSHYYSSLSFFTLNVQSKHQKSAPIMEVSWL